MLLVVPLLAVFMAAGEATQDTDNLHYRLRARIDPATQKLEAEVWIQSPPSTRFYLHQGFAIQKIEANGRPIGFHLGPPAPSSSFTAGAVTVEVDAPTAQRLHITYGGRMEGVIAGVNMIKPDLVELAFYSAWFPFFEGWRHYEFELEADLPQEYVATSNGRRKSQREQGDRSVTVWASYQPTFDMALLASPCLPILLSLHRPQMSSKPFRVFRATGTSGNLQFSK
jgi:hypothetical protein